MTVTITYSRNILLAGELRARRWPASPHKLTPPSSQQSTPTYSSSPHRNIRPSGGGSTSSSLLHCGRSSFRSVVQQTRGDSSRIKHLCVLGTSCGRIRRCSGMPVEGAERGGSAQSSSARYVGERGHHTAIVYPSGVCQYSSNTELVQRDLRPFSRACIHPPKKLAGARFAALPFARSLTSTLASRNGQLPV